MSSQSDLHLTRTNVWSSQLKTIFEDELIGQQFVKMLTDFPDGDTINIPSIGQASVNDYVENEPVTFSGLDTGNFTFTIDQYKSSATYLTDKHAQDSFYTSQLMSAFVPAQARAIGAAMEVNIWKQGVPSATGGAGGQTTADLNNINGQPHRFCGSTSTELIAVADFNQANLSLNVANIPMEGRVAVVDPTVAYQLASLSTTTTMTNNARWTDISTDGIMNGLTRLNMNIHGFDVYVSNNLHKNTAAETINSLAAASGAVNNMFFSTAPDAMPIIGAVRQAPRVETSRNIDRQRQEWVTTARYSHKLYRPEGLVIVVTEV
jgi:hypothetical protein